MKPITPAGRVALTRFFDDTDAWSRGRLLVIHDRSWWRGEGSDFRRRSYWLDRIDDCGARGLALGPVTIWIEPIQPKDGGTR